MTYKHACQACVAGLLYKNSLGKTLCYVTTMLAGVVWWRQGDRCPCRAYRFREHKTAHLGHEEMAHRRAPASRIYV